jgi:hypothetical protein
MTNYFDFEVRRYSGLDYFGAVIRALGTTGCAGATGWRFVVGVTGCNVAPG